MHISKTLLSALAVPLLALFTHGNPTHGGATRHPVGLTGGEKFSPLSLNNKHPSIKTSFLLWSHPPQNPFIATEYITTTSLVGTFKFDFQIDPDTLDTIIQVAETRPARELGKFEGNLGEGISCPISGETIAQRTFLFYTLNRLENVQEAWLKIDVALNGRIPVSLTKLLFTFMQTNSENSLNTHHLSSLVDRTKVTFTFESQQIVLEFDKNTLDAIIEVFHELFEERELAGHYEGNLRAGIPCEVLASDGGEVVSMFVKDGVNGMKDLWVRIEYDEDGEKDVYETKLLTLRQSTSISPEDQNRALGHTVPWKPSSDSVSTEENKKFTFTISPFKVDIDVDSETLDATVDVKFSALGVKLVRLKGNLGQGIEYDLDSKLAKGKLFLHAEDAEWGGKEVRFIADVTAGGKKYAFDDILFAL